MTPTIPASALIALAAGLLLLAWAVLWIQRDTNNANFWARLRPWLEWRNNPERPLTNQELDELRAARWD